MKKYLAGFIVGALFCGGIVFAEDALRVVENSFPIFVNGVQEEITAYNINGYTHPKLADFRKFGLGVVFSEGEGHIEISTTDEFELISFMGVKSYRYKEDIYISLQEVIERELLSLKDIPVDQEKEEGVVDIDIKETPDGITRLHYFDGFDKLPYVSFSVVRLKYDDLGYDFNVLVREGKNDPAGLLKINKATYQILKDGSVIVEIKTPEDIDPLRATDANIAIPYEYYVNNVMTFLQN